jgi:hypothetical protein
MSRRNGGRRSKEQEQGGPQKEQELWEQDRKKREDQTKGMTMPGGQGITHKHFCTNQGCVCCSGRSRSAGTRSVLVTFNDLTCTT